MPALSYNTLVRVQSALSKLADRMFVKTTISLSPEEFVSSFIQPEHVEKLKEVERLVGFVGTTHTYAKVSTPAGNSVAKILLSFIGRPPVILPLYIAHNGDTLDTADPAVVARIKAFVEERLRVGNMLGDAHDALDWLSEHCENASTMRIAFPALPTLLGAIDNDPASVIGKRAAKLLESKRFGSMPAMSPDIRDRLREVCALIQGLTLLSDAADPVYPNGHAVVSFRSAMVSAVRTNFFTGQGAASFL